MTVLLGLTVAIVAAATIVVPVALAQPAQTAPSGQTLAEANRLIAEAQKAPPAAAIPLYERALSLAEPSLGENHPDLALVLDVLGGGQDANGLEIEGFGALAQKQGARGVIATLWPVADESTGIFMQQFYRLREEKKLSRAEAMRQVQTAFIRGSASSAAGSYSHPYFWAPFILMGNWL